MVHHKLCPLCKSEKISVAFTCTDHFVSKDDFNLSVCSECSFKFTQDVPDEGDIGRYYESEDYISHSNTSKGFLNKLYRIARKLMLVRKRSVIRRATGLYRGSILDIGSGTGHFGDLMRRAGWEVKGVEINEIARKFSVSEFGLDVIGPDSISSLQSCSYDCITLWHVLEHFHDPFKYAFEIHRLLKPGAVCMIALPNSESYDSEYYGRFWAAYDVPRHLWHFCPSTFRAFAEKTGFKVERLLTLPLDVFYISWMSEKYKGAGMAFLKGIVTAKVFAWLALFNKEKSSSVIYLLRKSA